MPPGYRLRRVEGIGERVTATRPPAAQHVVLAHPPFPLSTAAVFGALRQDEWSGAEIGGNDLLAPARRLRPELDEVFSQVAAAGGEPRLSGSGPTVFSLTDDPERASGVVEPPGACRPACNADAPAQRSG